MLSDSLPRTQCGTFTGMVRTFSRPARFISCSAHATAFSSAAEPLTRLPIRSHRYSSLARPASSVNAAPISREDTSR